MGEEETKKKRREEEEGYTNTDTEISYTNKQKMTCGCPSLWT